MKKKYFIFIFIFFTHTIIYGQITKINFGIYRGFRYDKVDIGTPNKYILNKFIDNSDMKMIVPYFSMIYNEKLIFTFEYSRQFYMSGFVFKHPKTQFGGQTVSIEKGQTFNILGGYYFLSDENYRINIIPLIGLGIVKSGYYYGTFGLKRIWSQQNEDNTWTVSAITSEWKKDYGIHKYYLFLKINAKIIYKPVEFLELFLQIGYNQGFRTIGTFKGWVQVGNEPVIEINNKSKGTYLYYAIGSQLSFSLKNN